MKKLILVIPFFILFISGCSTYPDLQKLEFDELS